MDTVLLLGKGSRNCSIAEKLAESSGVATVFFAPGNPTRDDKIKQVDLDVSNFEDVYNFCKSSGVSYVVTGASELLEAGVVDYLQGKGVAVFGPTKAGAMIEASKDLGKEFMKRHGIMTPDHVSFDEYEEAKKYLEDRGGGPVVIKSDGLINGRGVSVCSSRAEALEALDKTMHGELLKGASKRVVIEEFIEGPEVSVHILFDGDTYTLFPLSQDHKPLLEGNKGPNTGGMGTYTPLDWVPQDIEDRIVRDIVEPTIKGLKEDGIEYRGCIFPGVMITKDGPMLLEYNTRFGAPETQSYMTLLKSDLNELFKAVINGHLKDYTIEWKSGVAVTVELVNGGYPEDEARGERVEADSTGLEPNERFYFGGIQYDTDGASLRAEGGKVLSISVVDDTLELARKRAYSLIDRVSYKDMYFRPDIGGLENKIPG